MDRHLTRSQGSLINSALLSRLCHAVSPSRYLHIGRPFAFSSSNFPVVTRFWSFMLPKTCPMKFPSFCENENATARHWTSSLQCWLQAIDAIYGRRRNVRMSITVPYIYPPDDTNRVCIFVRLCVPACLQIPDSIVNIYSKVSSFAGASKGDSMEERKEEKNL